MRQKDTYDLIQQQLTKELKIGMELIELQWEYKGKTFNSVAVVHKGGKFVYDPIGSLVLFENEIFFALSIAVKQNAQFLHSRFLGCQNWFGEL